MFSGYIILSRTINLVRMEYAILFLNMQTFRHLRSVKQKIMHSKHTVCFIAAQISASVFTAVRHIRRTRSQKPRQEREDAVVPTF